MEVADLRRAYEALAKKYRLPSFDEMDECFEIYKIDRESDFVLRSVRKQMMEKVVNSTGFVEMLLSGVNAPRMYMAYLNTMSSDDKKMLDEVYESFSKLILLSLELEIETGEKAEADLIKEIYSVWKNSREKLKVILKNLKNPKVNNTKKERSYFG